MSCPRCAAETERSRWCRDCERDYDGWSRQFAGEIVWEVLCGTVSVMAFGMGLPLLGLPWTFALAGIFAGFGTIVGLHRMNQRRHRRNYLAGAAMPRAYLPDKT
jgi:hypothetical protein